VAHAAIPHRSAAFAVKNDCGRCESLHPDDPGTRQLEGQNASLRAKACSLRPLRGRRAYRRPGRVQLGHRGVESGQGMVYLTSGLATIYKLSRMIPLLAHSRREAERVRRQAT
jgi:hypothetical protein